MTSAWQCEFVNTGRSAVYHLKRHFGEHFLHVHVMRRLECNGSRWEAASMYEAVSQKKIEVHCAVKFLQVQDIASSGSDVCLA